MGCWGKGLYDNDGALDRLDTLFGALDMDSSAVALTTSVGLRTWLSAPPTEAMAEAVRQRTDKVETLPKPARELLELLIRDEQAFGAARTRSAELVALLGRYCDGPRYEALLSLPGSEDVIADLAKSHVLRCALLLGATRKVASTTQSP